MEPVRVSGTEGYDDIDALVRRFEAISFGELHADILHLVPSAPARILDIGSGSGRDAAAFAAMGHAVVAVEPVAALRRRAEALHPSPRIEWVDDNLPKLANVTARGESFDVAMLTAVWMHLDASARKAAMKAVARLVRPGGVMTISLRHGPVPPGRRMFDVAPEETIAQAGAEGFDLLLRIDNQPAFSGDEDVHWTRLAFSKRAP